MKLLRWFAVLLITGATFAAEPDTLRPFPAVRYLRQLEERPKKMATIRWISQDGNWAAAGSWAGGVVPGASDTAQFDGTSQKNVLSGHTSGVTDILNLVVTEDYTGDIGQSGSLLTVNVTNRLTYRGSGTLYFKASSASGNAVAVIDSVNAVDAAVVDFVLADIGLVVKSGRVLMIQGGSGATYTVNASAGVPAILQSINISGARFNVLINNGGTVSGGWVGASGDIIVSNGGTMDLGNVDMGLSDVFVTGGTFSVSGNSTAAKSIQVLHMMGGVVDFSGLVNTYTVKTINLHGGKLIGSELLTTTNVFDFRKEYPDF